MKYTKKLTQIFLISVILSFITGCGQKFPQAYGIYMRKGNSWVPITKGIQSYPVTEKPEFLIFDPRLANTSPDSLITFHPVKWMRHNIKALVESREAAPHVYQKSGAERFVTLNPALKLKFIPVKNQSNMLLILPEAQLDNGYFSLGVFDDEILCRKNVSANPAELPESCVLDEWSTCMDQSRGFSWDVWMTGGVFNEQLAPPQKLARLMGSLENELAALVAAKNNPQLIAFCKKVEGLDSDLYTKAKRQCIETIEATIQQAEKDKNIPMVIGVGLMAKKEGFTSDFVLKEIDEGARAFSNIEALTAKTAGNLLANRDNVNPKSAGFQLNMGLLVMRRTVSVEESHIIYKSQVAAYPVETTARWMGDIQGLREIDQDTVEVVGDWYKMYNKDTFQNSYDKGRFFSAVVASWEKWETIWGSRLTLEVIAQPHYWSERVFVYDLPYIIERIDGVGEVLVGKVAPNSTVSDNGYMPTEISRFAESEKQLKLPCDGQFRVMTSGNVPVKLRIRFCPDLDEARNRFAWKFATDPKFYNPAKALEYSKKAYAGMSDKWYVLGTYAAACAANGAFEEAAKMQGLSITLLQKDDTVSDDKEAAIRDSKNRLALYKANKPFIEKRVDDVPDRVAGGVTTPSGYTAGGLPANWKGTYKEPGRDPYLVLFRIDVQNGNNISGVVHYPTMGDTKTKFRGSVGNGRIIFTEYELIQGKGAIVPVEYDAVINGSVMEGSYSYKTRLGVATGPFRLEQFVDSESSADDTVRAKLTKNTVREPSGQKFLNQVCFKTQFTMSGMPHKNMPASENAHYLLKSYRDNSPNGTLCWDKTSFRDQNGVEHLVGFRMEGQKESLKLDVYIKQEAEAGTIGVTVQVSGRGGKSPSQEQAVDEAGAVCNALSVHGGKLQ